MAYRIECTDCGLEAELDRLTAYERAKEHEKEHASHWVTVSKLQD